MSDSERKETMPQRQRSASMWMRYKDEGDGLLLDEASRSMFASARLADDLFGMLIGCEFDATYVGPNYLTARLAVLPFSRKSRTGADAMDAQCFVAAYNRLRQEVARSEEAERMLFELAKKQLAMTPQEVRAFWLSREPRAVPIP